jgi:hypothetical protein
MVNDDVLPRNNLICNVIEVSLKTTVKTYIQIYVDVDKSSHALEWQIVDRSEVIIGNVEFDQRCRIVPIAIQRWSKLIAENLRKIIKLGFQHSPSPHPILTFNKVSFDIRTKSIASIDVNRLSRKSSSIRSVNNAIDDGSSNIRQWLMCNCCSHVHTIKSNHSRPRTSICSSVNNSVNVCRHTKKTRETYIQRQLTRFNSKRDLADSRIGKLQLQFSLYHAHETTSINVSNTNTRRTS